jgi:hypothetical protein
MHDFSETAPFTAYVMVRALAQIHQESLENQNGQGVKHQQTILEARWRFPFLRQSSLNPVPGGGLTSLQISIRGVGEGTIRHTGLEKVIENDGGLRRSKT